MSPRSRLHAIGPLPPPRGGATLNFDIFTEEVRIRSAALGIDTLRVTNTSPSKLRTTHAVTWELGARQARLLRALSTSLLRREAVALFCSERQFVGGIPALLALRAAGLPVVVKFTGAELPLFLRSLGPAPRRAMLAALNAVTTILVQTRGSLDEAQAMGVRNALQSPGYRRVDWQALPALPASPLQPGQLRLVFLGLLAASKGVHHLLRALSRLGRPDISLDLYGQVPPAERDVFATLLQETPGATVKGVFSGDPAGLLARYDALVLSCVEHEGHSGAVIEAMAGGIPVLVSRFQALLELVTDGDNGLVVEPGDVDGLARAIATLADRPDERLRMGRAHRSRLGSHDARRAVDLILSALDGPRQRDGG